MPDRQVTISPMPLRRPAFMSVPKGLSIKGIIARMYEESRTPAIYRDYRVMVEVNGEPVSHDNWGGVPGINDHVLVYVPVRGGGGGGKDPMRTVLMLAVVAASIAAPYGIAAMTGGNLVTFAGMSVGATTSMYSGVALTAGMFLVNAFCPTRLPGVSQPDAGKTSQSYSISGARNTSNPFGPVPVVLGTHKVYPKYGATPYTEILGNEEYLRMILVWGYGPLDIGTIKIGETPLTAYTDYEVETYDGTTTGENSRLFPVTAHQDAIGVELSSGASVVRYPAPNVDYISVDFAWPYGLWYSDEEGNHHNERCRVEVWFREAGSGGAETLAGAVDLSWWNTNPIRRGIGWSVDRSKAYEVRVVKATADGDNQYHFNTVQWVSLRGLVNTDPITFPFPLSYTVLKIKATEQLNGVIDSLNAVVSSRAMVWNGSNWGGSVATKNPAALYLAVLKHPANARRLTDSQIDLAGLGAWYTFCAARGYEFNQYRDYRKSVCDCLADIAAAGRASPTQTDGLWGVVVDTGVESVVQSITPRNSWGFSAEKAFYHRPHAFRVQFINENENYQTDEIIVYDDGYSAANATQFETIEFPGITSPSLAWKFGRYHIAQARLRLETYSVYQDWEHLVCRRGSKIRCAYDVPMWGTGWGRVKSVTLNEAETHITGVVLDDTVVMAEGTLYGVRFRLPDEDNTSLYLSVVTEAGQTNTLTFSTAVPVASGPAVNDLAMFGEANRESVELLVKEVQMQNEFTARLIMVDEAPAIYTADTGTIPAFDTHITRPVDITRLVPQPPAITNVRSGTECLEVLNGAIRARIFVSLYPPKGNIKIGHYRIRYTEITETDWHFADVSPENLLGILADVADGVIYSIQAQSITIYGVASAWSEAVTHTVIGQGADPSDVDDLSCNIVGTSAFLSWSPVTDLDLSHYRIKWSPLTSGATWANAVDVVDRVGKPATTITAPAMVGTYLIKAVDYAGNMSATAGAAITSIAAISGLNVVETVTQPPFSGTGSGVAYIPDLSGLMLESEDDLYDATDLYAVGDLYIENSLLAEGTYTFDNDIVDLGAVYTARVTASITATGANLLTDLYNFIDLYEGGDLYGSPDGSYSAALEIRTTQDDTTGAPTWTAWQSFMVGDYTARGFEFRVRLKGTPPGITPIVTGITASIDMPDRVIGFSAAVGVGGADVAFSPAFYAIPEIGISVSDGDEGDGYTITGKSVSGFHIAFTNGGSGVARNISGIAKGYGEVT